MTPMSTDGPPVPSSRGRASAFCAIAMTVVLAPASTLSSQEVIDRMLAVVAGDLIMMSDVTAALELGLVPVTAGSDTTRLVLSQLIDRSLMLAEVERYAPPEPGADRVDLEVERTRGRFSTLDAYRAALQRYGIDEARLRATLRATLRLRAYLEQRFAALAPSDADLTAYYAIHADRFARDGLAVSLADVRHDVVQALTIDRRQAMVDGWIADLRRRATVVDLSAPRPGSPW
jgi:hypothetical protein